MNQRIRIARGTTTDLLASNEVPEKGFPFYDTQKKLLFIGQGTGTGEGNTDKKIQDYNDSDGISAYNLIGTIDDVPIKGANGVLLVNPDTHKTTNYVNQAVDALNVSSTIGGVDIGTIFEKEVGVLTNVVREASNATDAEILAGEIDSNTLTIKIRTSPLDIIDVKLIYET